MKRIIALFFLFLSGLALFGQDIVVAYVDGLFEVRVAGRWNELLIGDFVNEDDEIRLARGAYAELATTDTTVKLSRAGVFRVDELITLTNRNESAGLGGFLMNHVGRLSSQNKPPNQTAAGGARASEAQNTPSTTWQGGATTGALIQEGLQLLEAGEIEEAYYIFEEAWDFALTDQQYREALFYYGYASSLLGRTAQGIDLLSEVGPDPDSRFYVSHALVLGQLLLESVAHEEAVELLNEVEADSRLTAQERQSAQLMLGLAYAGMGQTRNARESLVRARDLLPGNEAADAARTVLADL
jgi:tetratricopeptide (TPR) repeat protein